jgi:cyclomaltodextrinase
MQSYQAPDWVQDAIFYQVFPDRFSNGDPRNDPPGTQPWGSPPTKDNFLGGDLQGIQDRLPYLQDLGVNALYLTPIFQARSNHKYDTCDYLRIDPAFGDEGLLCQLVEDAHQRGIRVILDAVLNHCGDCFWAFEDVRLHGSASPYANWFYPQSFPLTQDPLNYQTCGGEAYLPKLNLENPEVRKFLLQVGRHWIDTCGIDGWRLDVPWKAPMDFWREFRTAVKSANPQAYIVAETWRDTAHWLQGDTCDGTMNYPLRDYILDYCVRDTMDAEDFDYFTHRLRIQNGDANRYQLNLLGSHDTPRLLTLCGRDVQRAVLAVTAQFTLPGVPMIYYGDEVGLEGDNDPDCRRTMPWDPTQWNTQLNMIYRALIRTRHEHPAIRTGSFEKLWVFNGVYAYLRRSGEDGVVIILNPRGSLHGLSIPVSGKWHPGGEMRDVITGRRFTNKGDAIFIEDLPARTALVLV